MGKLPVLVYIVHSFILESQYKTLLIGWRVQEISKFFAYYGEQGFWVENPCHSFATEVLADFQPKIATPCSARLAKTESRALRFPEGFPRRK
jgi:hypothetical protein